jgi:hypothetical protein
MTSSGRRLGVTVQGGERASSKIMKTIYKDNVTGELITVFKLKVTDQPSNKGGVMKAGESGNYKTLLSGPDKTEFSTLAEAESAKTKYYKENPGKRIKDPTKDKISKDNRRLDIKKNEGVESYKTGDGDVVKGHSSNIAGKNKIQPDNLIYTNKDINALMANTEGVANKADPTSYDSLDFKQRQAEKEIDRIKKSKLPPAEKKKLLAVQDNKLVEYVGMSDGYKTATLSDGTKYGTSFKSLQSMDPFSEFPGMSEKEVKEFVGEYFTQDRIKNGKLEYGTLKPKYAKLSKKEMQTLPQSVKDNIVKAYTFNENVKLAKGNAQKAEVKFPDAIKKKLMKIGCGMYAGGRVGFKDGSKCITKALKKMDNPKGLSAVESRLAKEVVSESKKLAKAGSWIKGDLYFAAAEMFNNWSKGQGFLRGVNNAFELATLGAVDVEADEYALSQLIKKQGSKEDKEAFADYLNAAKKFNKLQSAETSLKNAEETLASDEIIGPDDQMLLESRIKEEPKRVKKLEKIAMDTLEKDDENPTIDKGYRIMNEYIERLAAEDWNKTAGTAADRGIREMVGAKGDEGFLYGLGFGFDKFKKYRPQDTMNYHPVYGYKEALKKEMRRGNSPMEDILYSMDEYAPDNLLQIEAERPTTKIDDKNVDMGIYDYRKAEGGIMSLKRKK